MRLRKGAVGVAVASGLACTLCYGALIISDSGTWPGYWPKELEPFRSKAKTVEVAHGIQETDYEIRFNNADEFVKAWPHILTLKSQGAPLILEKGPSTSTVSGSTLARGVRILCPPGNSAITKTDGTEMSLESKAPGPESILSASGDLPEYVVMEHGQRVPFTGDNQEGFRFRARVDIVLVVDGLVIDLNRIQLPTDTPIVDNRFRDTDSH